MSSVSSTGSLGTSGLRGYGGLASGLDRDTLIEQMTAGTRSKIAVQKQRKQSMVWKQDAYRSITSKLLAFTDNYMSMTSSKSLYNSTLFSPSKINTSGTYSKFVSATGTSLNASQISVLGVKQLASNASITTDKIKSTSSMDTEAIDLSKPTWTETLEGESISVTYGNKSYSVVFSSSGKDADGNTVPRNYDTVDNAIASMNASLADKEAENGKKLSEIMEFYKDSSGKIGVRNIDTDSNHLEVSGNKSFEAMGFLDSQKIDLTENRTHVASSEAVLKTDQKPAGEKLQGTSMNFSYNGTTKAITLSGTYNTMEELREDLEKELGKAFGEGRIKVSANSDPSDPTNAGKGSLSFQTTTPGTGADDPSSILKITGGSYSAREILGVENGASNRINLNGTLKHEFGLTNGQTSLEINGVTIDGITEDTTVGELIAKINNSDAGVKASYVEGTDKFIINSTADGASGKVDVTSGTLADTIFKGASAAGPKRGQDAVISVDYGAGVEEIQRGSNTFDLDGMSVTVSGTFGYDDTTGALINGSDAVTFKPEMDTEKATSAISDFIKDFNEIIALVNSEYTTRPDRNYFPLTDEQKEDMSEEEIKAWEKEAKKGLLFNDNELSNLASDLRMTLSGLDRNALEKIGITTSDSYSDNGKLVFDETKFKAALENDPEAVQKVFSNSDGKSGLADKMENTIQKYAKKTGSFKGSLIQLAGATESPLSLTQNSMYNQIKQYDEVIENLNNKLETEQDRYIKQFTSLETLISQMNSQSSWLSSQFG